MRPDTPDTNQRPRQLAFLGALLFTILITVGVDRIAVLTSIGTVA
jgi:hypothetical protein